MEMVQGIRERHPRLGGRKLYHELRQAMSSLGITRGRDAFFAVLGKYDLLVPAKRSRRRTTRSGLWRCPNLLAELKVKRIHQAWIADITYITTEGGFVYLALITDVYSRYIVGDDLSSSLAVEGCLRALEQALRESQGGSLQGLIHHSDHGVQYTSEKYRENLDEVQAQSSMGEVGNCYENAMAERVIGILKDEYALDALFVNERQARHAAKEAIWLYNNERPHLALDYQKPAEVFYENR